MSIVKDTISITVITLVAGLAMGVVQDITAEDVYKRQLSVCSGYLSAGNRGYG